MDETNFPIAPKMVPFLLPSRFKSAYGGRGGGKSHAIAKLLLLMADEVCLRILCAREIQVSIKDSVHKLLRDYIDSEELNQLTPGIRNRYSITDNAIKNLVTGSEFLFKGLRHNISEIKSTEGIDICWVEEAANVSQSSWDVLIPTIRKPNSEIWISYNPVEEKDPVHIMTVINPDADMVAVEINFSDNPHLPEVLYNEAIKCKERDLDAYNHIWLGKCKKFGDALVFKNKFISYNFEPDPQVWDGPYFGADWGFSTDPTALVKCWIYDETAFIEYEAYGHEIDNDTLPKLFDSIPFARQFTIRADCSRPETINHMQRHGYPNVTACEKWPGSVEDGIAWIRGCKQVVIHPRCTHTLDEFGLYSYKVDAKTKEVLPIILDKNNHICDALRYALQPHIKNNNSGLLDYYRTQSAEKPKPSGPSAFMNQ